MSVAAEDSTANAADLPPAPSGVKLRVMLHRWIIRERRSNRQSFGLGYIINDAPLRPVSDAYFHLMRVSWLRLGVIATVAYLLAVGAFTVLYRLGGDCIEGAEPGSWLDTFWFAAHTLTTLGVEGMGPATDYAHLIATVQSLVGVAAVAVYTAVAFARFARPTARVVFADVAVIQPRNGVPSLQIRLANERPSAVLGARLSLFAMMDDVTAEGQRLRRMRNLELLRHEVPMMALTWTAIHLIDETSPLHGLSPENVGEQMLMLFASFDGVDETFGQAVYTRHRYDPEQVLFDRCFADMVDQVDDGVAVHLSRLHQTVPLDQGSPELDDPLDVPE